jgi:hypothetical protein
VAESVGTWQKKCVREDQAVAAIEDRASRRLNVVDPAEVSDLVHPVFIPRHHEPHGAAEAVGGFEEGEIESPNAPRSGVVAVGQV